MENTRLALEVTLGSSADTSVGHNHTNIYDLEWSPSGPLIIFNIVFSISVTRLTHYLRQN
jgi:hypothetical protein